MEDTNTGGSVRVRTDDELKELCRDVYARHVFMDWMIWADKPDMTPDRIASDLRMVFMPLALVTADQAKEISEMDVAIIYEYMDRAGPQSVNGYPCFMSMRTLTEADASRWRELYLAYLEFQKEWDQPMGGQRSMNLGDN